jgi:hypothetical protein
MEEQPKIIYSSYTEAQKRATAKYREANKEKVNAQRKKYYESRKEKDPEFLQYKRDKAKEYYLKKKVSKVDIIDDTNIELVKIDVPSVPEPDEEKPPLAWSNDEVKVEPVFKKERKSRVVKPKPNLKLEDLQELLEPISEPKTPKKPRSKKILEPSDILHSA